MKNVLFVLLIFFFLISGCSSESFEIKENDLDIEDSQHDKNLVDIEKKDEPKPDSQSQYKNKLNTDIEVVQIFAKDTSDSQINLGDELTLVVRLGSGSNSVNFNDLILKMDTMEGSQTIRYDSSLNISTQNYNVNYVSNGGFAQTKNFLETGDLVEIKFLNEMDIFESQTATIRLLTKNGAVKPIDITTPSNMKESTTYLFP